jgi:hypothetical protein
VTEILSTVFIVGSGLTDTLEVWVLALIFLIIAIDLIVGIRHKVFLIFSGLQAIGMVGGYLWASWVALQQDVAGPYAWAFVVGTWFFATAISHIIFATVRLITPRLKP